MHMAQLMPLPLTVSCSSKIQTGFTFLVPAHPGSPGQGAVKQVCVCVCVCVWDVEPQLNQSTERRRQRDHIPAVLPWSARLRHDTDTSVSASRFFASRQLSDDMDLEYSGCRDAVPPGSLPPRPPRCDETTLPTQQTHDCCTVLLLLQWRALPPGGVAVSTICRQSMRLLAFLQAEWIPMLTDCTSVSIAFSQLVRGRPQGLLQ